jgi:hypothetical protein
VRLRDLVRMEQELAGDARVLRTRGPKYEDRDVFRCGAQQQIRIRNFTLVMSLLLVRQSGERRAIR